MSESTCANAGGEKPFSLEEMRAAMEEMGRIVESDPEAWLRRELYRFFDMRPMMYMDPLAAYRRPKPPMQDNPEEQRS